MKKGELFITKGSNKVYQIVGRWDQEVVLAPLCETEEQVLIYTTTELEELIRLGHFRKLHQTGIKVSETKVAKDE